MLNRRKFEKKYTTYDEKSYEKLLDIIRSMKAYSLDAPNHYKISDIYYDSPSHVLVDNHLLVRRRITGKKALLAIMRTHYEDENFYMDHLRSGERKMEIDATDPLSKHYFFLNRALNSMFTNALQFDTDKLFEQMKVIMTMDIDAETRTILGFGGLKLEIRREKLSFENKLTLRKNKMDIIRFKMLSEDSTFDYFEDFMSKIEKRFKEIFPLTECKYDIAARMTKPLPTKQEMKERIKEIEKLEQEQKKNKDNQNKETDKKNEENNNKKK